MKATSILALISGLALFCACQQHKPADDPEKLKSVLLAYFDGIRNKDFKKMTDATTDDFVLYEMGRVWSNDSVFKEMKKFPYTVVYKFDNFKINIDLQSGHMTYNNHGEFAFDSTKQSFDWIESAAFRKTEVGWKMYFLHITERYSPSTSQK
ncbi:MAG TPA: nuclear transport factor 2 family protein [Chryseolinea sp.]